MSSSVTLRRRPESFTGRSLDAIELEHARELWAHTRAAHGFKLDGSAPLTQSGEGNAKLSKNSLPTVGLTIAPHRLADVGNACTMSTADCRRLCLFTAGHGQWNSTQRARIARAVMLARYPLESRAMIRDELERALKRAGRRRVAFRPNVTSDLPWHLEPWMSEMSPRLVPYGYTKHRDYLTDAGRYDFTFSVSERERGLSDAVEVLEHGHRVAVVVPVDETLPQSVDRWPVIDGDASDERYKDPVGIVTLRAKGAAKDPDLVGLHRFVKPFADWCAA